MIKRYYRQILLIVSLVAVLALAVLVFARASINQYVESANRSTLARTKGFLDTTVEEIHNTAFQLNNSIMLIPLKRAENIFDRKTLPSTLSYQKSLDNYGVYNQYIHLNFTLFVTSKYVIMPGAGQDLVSFSRAFSDADYPAGYGIDGFVGLLMRHDTEFLPPMQYANGTKEPVEVIPYVIWGTRNIRARQQAVVILVDASKVRQMLARSLATDKSLICIVDERGKIVASSRDFSGAEQRMIVGDAPLTGGLKRYMDTAKSTSWRCVLLSDDSEALQSLERFTQLIGIISAAAFCVVFGVAALMIRKNQTMLRSLYDMIDTNQRRYTDNDVYQQVSLSIRNMLEDKASMQSRMRAQQAVIQEVYINNLLKGDKPDFADDLRVLREAGFHRENHYYYASIISLEPSSEAAAQDEDIRRAKNIITEALKVFSQDILCCNINRLETALIIRTKYDQEDPRNRAFVELMFGTLKKVINENQVPPVKLSVGGIHTGDSAIPVSFSEARLSVFDAGLREPGRDIVWYQRRQGMQACYYYPPEVEIQFVNAIRSGNRLIVEKAIKELFDQNALQHAGEYEMTVAFLYDFCGSVLKIAPSNELTAGIQQELFAFYKQNSSEIASLEFQRSFIDYIYRLTEAFHSSKKSHNQALIEEIERYTKEHCGDYELTLYNVADQFGLSSGYLSTFFREQTGVTFSDFVIGAKMDKAKELIQTTQLTVNEIAEQCGYASANTFCRAFKKHFGVSPMQMR